jgi:5-methylcytosine-specific restriction endonuclease McrA
MRHDTEGRITEVGARTRTIPPALRRELYHRDKGCRFPGCGRPFGEGHHIQHWANSGPTTLSNLAMLCRRQPPPAAVPANPTETLQVQNDGAGVQINARTSMPGWQGERLDVGYAISVLHPLAGRPIAA